MNRCSCLPLQYDYRLALVRDADGSYVSGFRANQAKRFRGSRESACKDFSMVVLDPSLLGIELLEFVLCSGGNRTRLVKTMARELVVP